MSQKKVDAYKARKSTRGRADKKEKMMFTLEMFAWAFICVVVVAWIGYSAYVKVAGTKAEVVQNTVLDTSALDNYISGIDTDTRMQTLQKRLQMRQMLLIQQRMRMQRQQMILQPQRIQQMTVPRLQMILQQQRILQILQKNNK